MEKVSHNHAEVAAVPAAAAATAGGIGQAMIAFLGSSGGGGDGSGSSSVIRDSSAAPVWEHLDVCQGTPGKSTKPRRKFYQSGRCKTALLFSPPPPS